MHSVVGRKMKSMKMNFESDFLYTLKSRNKLIQVIPQE